MNKQRACILPSNKITRCHPDEEYIQEKVDAVVRFIIQHRRNKVFKDWNKEQIEFAVVIGSEQNLFFKAEEDGVVVGAALLKKKEQFSLHVSELLLTQAGLLPRFLKRLLEVWPATKYLTAVRYGKNVRFKVSTLRRILGV